MKRFFKALSVVFLVPCISVFSLIAYGSENLPVFAEADVVVCGCGPGGIGAALMSAASGASTVVLEAYGLPGGMAAISEVHPFMLSIHDGKSLDAPVYESWRKTMCRYLPENMMLKPIILEMTNITDAVLKKV